MRERGGGGCSRSPLIQRGAHGPVGPGSTWPASAGQEAGRRRPWPPAALNGEGGREWGAAAPLPHTSPGQPGLVLLPPPGCGQGGAVPCAGRRGRRRPGWPPATPKREGEGRGCCPLQARAQGARWPPGRAQPPAARRRRSAPHRGAGGEEGGGGGRVQREEKRERKRWGKFMVVVEVIWWGF